MAASAPTCPDCRHVHAGTDMRAIGRFTGRPCTYRAHYGGAPERATRDEAMRDACQHRQEALR